MTWHVPVNFASTNVSDGAMNNTNSPLTFAVADGSKFGSSFPLWAVVDASGTPEVIEITARSGNNLTATRENAIAHAGSPKIFCGSAEYIAELQAAVDAVSGGSSYRVVLASNQSQAIGSATLSKIAFQTSVENVGEFTVTGGTDIAVPAAGNYRVIADVFCSNGGGPIASLQLRAGSTLIGRCQQVPAIPASAAAFAPIPNLVAHYPLNESSGTNVVDAVAGVSGSTSAPSVPGRPGGAYAYARDISSSTDGIDLGATFQNTAGESSTYALWMYWNGWLTTQPEGHTIFARPQNDYDLIIFKSGEDATVNFYGPNGNFGTGTSVLTVGMWHHVVLRIDRSSGVADIFIDNVKRSTGTGQTSNMSGGNAHFRLGYNPNYTSRKFNGYVSDFQVYNRALTDAEISGLYNYPHVADGTTMNSNVPGAPDRGQTFSAIGYANGLAGGDVITASFYHEKGSDATLKAGAGGSRIVVEKL